MKVFIEGEWAELKKEEWKKKSFKEKMSIIKDIIAGNWEYLMERFEAFFYGDVIIIEDVVGQGGLGTPYKKVIRSVSIKYSKFNDTKTFTGFTEHELMQLYNELIQHQDEVNLLSRNGQEVELSVRLTNYLLYEIQEGHKLLDREWIK